jgi:hypothetical protein
MTRMTREFSLLLLGSGMLTSGYFLWPEQDFEQRSEEQAEKRVGGRSTTSGGARLIYIGSYSGSRSFSSAGRSPAMGSVSRGGFGSIGGRVGGGTG